MSSDELATMRRLDWHFSSPRGIEVLRYAPALRLLAHPGLQKGPANRRKLDDLGLPPDAYAIWDRQLSVNEGQVRDRLRKPLSELFRPARMGALQAMVRGIVEGALEEIEDPENADLLALAWKIAPRVYCGLVSAPLELAPIAAGLSDSALAPILTGDRARVGEAATAIRQSYAFVEHHLAERGDWTGSDFTAGLLRMQAEGSIDREELIHLGISLLHASIDNTVHQMAMTLGTLLERAERWQALLAKPTRLAAAVEEAIRLNPRFGTLLRFAPEAGDVEGITISAGGYVFLSVRSCNRDETVFEDPDSFRLDRPPMRALMFGGGSYDCLGQTLARLEIHELLKAVMARYPGIRLAREWAFENLGAVSEARLLRAALV